MGNAAIASGDFIQGQGDPAGRQKATPALGRDAIQHWLPPWERFVPSLYPQINTPKHHFLSRGFAAGT